MRVTANTFPNTLVDQLGRLTVRQNRLQAQAATGQRIRLPEDDPTAMRRVLDLQASARTEGQFKENIARLRETAQADYELLRDLKHVSDRAGEIAVMSDGTKPASQLQLYAVEITQLIKHAVQIANTQFRDSYLLAGTRSDQPPFVMSTDANGNVTGVVYQGNTNTAQVEIAEGFEVPANSVGANTTGTGERGVLADSRTGSDLFAHLITLQNNLLAGDIAAIAGTSLPALGRDEENLLLHVGENGAGQARLEASLAISTRRADTVEALVSREVDADLAQTIVRLTQTQTAYQAALQSGAQLLNSSLLDYIR